MQILKINTRMHLVTVFVKYLLSIENFFNNSYLYEADLLPWMLQTLAIWLFRLPVTTFIFRDIINTNSRHNGVNGKFASVHHVLMALTIVFDNAFLDAVEICKDWTQVFDHTALKGRCFYWVFLLLGFVVLNELFRHGMRL